MASDELIKSIQKLIDSGREDAGRLSYILDSIKKGKTLYTSDQKYLDHLLTRNMISNVMEEQVKIDTGQEADTKQRCYLCSKNLGKLSLKVTQDDMKLAKVVVPEGMKINERICRICFSTLQQLQEDDNIKKNILDSVIDNQLKFCSKCGSQIQVLNEFCTECGFSIKNIQYTQNTMTQNNTDQRPKNTLHKDKKAIRKATISLIISLIPIVILIYYMVNFSIPGLMENNEKVNEAHQRLEDATLNLINTCWSESSVFCDQEMIDLKEKCKTDTQFMNIKACSNGKLVDYIISRGL